MSPIGLIDHSDAIDEYPTTRFGKRGQSNVESPSRFKLGMYRKNRMLEHPRRNNLTLKWESTLTKKTPITEVKHRNTIMDQFMNDYASARPGPTIVHKKLRMGNQTTNGVQDQMFVASLKDEEAHTVRSSMDKGLITYN